MKKTNTYISVILSLIISSLIAAPFITASAASTNQGMVELEERGTCYKGLGTEYKEGLVKGTYIFTVIEEGLVQKQEKIGDAIIKKCFRVVACKDPERKTSCVSFLNEKCELASGQGSVKEETEEETATEVPVSLVSCKKTQLIISPAGTGLLYAYIGMAYKWVASIIGVIAVLIIIISGIQIAAASGDTGKVDEAKGRIIRALAGLAVLFLSGLILYTINPTFFIK